VSEGHKAILAVPLLLAIGFFGWIAVGRLLERCNNDPGRGDDD
jgi:hypothetical protein